MSTSSRLPHILYRPLSKNFQDDLASVKVADLRKLAKHGVRVVSITQPVGDDRCMR